MRYAKWSAWVAAQILVLSLLAQVNETWGLYEAFREGIVDLQVYGSGIQRVRGTITRKAGSRPIRIKIPPGTLFNADSGSVQNMVVTETATVDLTRSRSAAFTASVACSDLHLSVPGEGDSFSVEQLPPRKAEIVNFFPVANKAGVSYETKQAGVWIVTDNADYQALGILVGGFGGGNGRAINAGEAAGAMALLDKAGIDVSSRAIWRERLPICSAAFSKELSATSWCEQILRDTSSPGWKIASLSAANNPAVPKAIRKWLLQAKDDETKVALVHALNARQMPKPEAMVTIIEALGNYTGTDSGDAILPLLGADEPAVKVAAINSLTKIKDLRTPEAVRSLTSSTEALNVRLAAIHSLGTLGSYADDLPVLEEVSKEASPKVKGAALQAIQQLKKRPPIQ